MQVADNVNDWRSEDVLMCAKTALRYQPLLARSVTMLEVNHPPEGVQLIVRLEGEFCGGVLFALERFSTPLSNDFKVFFETLESQYARHLDIKAVAP